MNWKRNVTVFLAGQCISLLGSSLVQFAITWYITMTTQSGMAMTVSVICGYLPQLCVSLFAGVWADRYNRKKIIMLADGCIAVSTAVLAIFFYAGYRYLWLLYFISVIRSLGSAVQSPTVSAVIPTITPKERLMRVNAINGGMQALLSLIAPALGGVLLTALGSIEVVFLIDVATAVIAIACVAFFLKLDTPKGKPSHTVSYMQEIKEGFSYIRRSRLLVHMLLYMTAISIMIAPIVMLVPLQIVRSYGEEVWYVSAVEIVLSLGMLLGGGLISLWGGFKNRVHTMVAAVFGIAFAMMMIGFQIPFSVYLCCIFAAGMFAPMILTPANVILQEYVENRYLGRVFSVISTVSSSMTPLGMLVFGPLADQLPISWLLIATGVLILCMGFVLCFDSVAISSGRRDASGNTQDGNRTAC